MYYATKVYSASKTPGENVIEFTVYSTDVHLTLLYGVDTKRKNLGSFRTGDKGQYLMNFGGNGMTIDGSSLKYGFFKNKLKRNTKYQIKLVINF